MDTMVAYYTKDKKVYHYYPTTIEVDEITERNRKLAFIRSKEDEKRRDDWLYEHKGGYCPKCFLLRTITGVCTNCNE